MRQRKKQVFSPGNNRRTKMIYNDFQGMKLSALGMGNMRLPVINGNDGKPPLQSSLPKNGPQTELEADDLYNGDDNNGGIG